MNCTAFATDSLLSGFLSMKVAERLRQEKHQAVKSQGCRKLTFINFITCILSIVLPHSSPLFPFPSMKETTNPLFQFAQENTNFLSLWCSACHWFSVNRFPPVLLRPVMIFLVPKHKKIYISEIAERDHYEPWHRSPLSHGSRDVINTVEINTVWSNDIITIATRNSAND